MTENIVVPALGESIAEATVSKWIKKQGDQVSYTKCSLDFQHALEFHTY